ncbi:MAG: hypothetical protein K6G30_14630 [Acetatifactor sp.]|nr:hypothetical protein [Acetatifactor sp.]
MKRTKLLAWLLAIALSFSTMVPSAFAAEVPAQATGDAITPEEASSFLPEASEFTTHVVTLPAGTTSVVKEIHMSHSGYVFVPMSITGTQKSITVEMFSDAACTSKIGYSKSLGSSYLTATLSAPISKEGTYYLRFSTYSAMDNNVDITLRPYCYDSSERKIAAKKTVYSYSGSNDLIYHKISIAKPGYIKVDATSNNSVASLYVTLCNNKKKPQSEQSYISSSLNTDGLYFAVKKGTYYLATKSSDIVSLKYTFTAVKEKSGAKQDKAVAIKAGSTVKGLIQSSDKTTTYDYYKVSLNSTKKLSLTASTKCNDRISFKVIPANSKLHLFGDTLYLSSTGKETFVSTDKLPKGTYYIQVSKYRSTTSGFYTIKFNK